MWLKWNKAHVCRKEERNFQDLFFAGKDGKILLRRDENKL